MIAAVGVDLGATWLSAVALDQRGRAVRRARLPAVPWRASAPVLRTLLRRWRAGRPRLCVGATGVWTRSQCREWETLLRRLGRPVRAMPDIELAWRAAFGDGPGVLVLAGTGSIMYGGDARGRRARVGGWGALLGDDGSGFWIGREWLRGRPEAEILRYAHRKDCVRATAALAPKVLSRRDPRSRRIVSEAHRALSSQAVLAARKLRLKGPIPVYFHGGLFRSEAFRKGLLAKLPGWRPVAKLRDASTAAALYALRGIW